MYFWEKGRVKGEGNVGRRWGKGYKEKEEVACTCNCVHKTVLFKEIHKDKV